MKRVRCINCEAEMEERSCKVRCPRCGLFYDCGDGMLPMPEGEESRSSSPSALSEEAR